MGPLFEPSVPHVSILPARETLVIGLLRETSFVIMPVYDPYV
jgi:hypothetical protein